MKKQQEAPSIIMTSYEKAEHSVNLLHTAPQGAKIARKGRIRLDDRKAIFGPNIKAKVTPVLEITPPKELEVNNLEKMLRISFIEEEYDNKKELALKQLSVPYIVEFYPDEILDCKVVETASGGIGESVFIVNYTIRILRDKKTISTLDCKLNVRIEPIFQYKPKVYFQPEREYRDGIVYNSKVRESIKIGYLCVSNAGRFYRTPALDLDLSVAARIDDKPISNLLKLGDKTTVIIPDCRSLLNPYISKDENEDDDESQSNIGSDRNCIGANDLSNGVRISSLVVEPRKELTVKIPVFLQMQEIKKNPPQSSFIQIQAISTFRRYYDNESVRNTQIDEDLFELHRNPAIMDLEVYAGPKGCMGNPNWLLKNDDNLIIPAEYQVVATGTIGYPKLQFELIVKNTAESVEEGKEDACIYIKDMEIGNPTPANGYIVNLQEGKHLKPDMFSFSDLPSPLIFLKAKDKDNVFKIDIDYSDEFLAGMKQMNNEPVFNTFINVQVKFDYFLDKDGKKPVSPNYSTFDAKLQFRIFKRAAPEWFCLDFGTSAVVASFARALDDNEERLIRLEKQKAAHMASASAWPNDGRMREDEGEGSPFLISSAAVLQDTNLIMPSDTPYRDQPVLFSPPSRGYTNYYGRLLPCLKSLVGNDTIPNELIPTDTRNRNIPNVKVKVEKVLELIYGQLFSFFIPEKVQKTQKLVLSYPNTFSPPHLDLIKKIAKATFKDLRTDYLRFISESDAVAFYYNHYRSHFHRNSASLLKGRGENYDKNILVYDMGAGTLDLTYFTRASIQSGATRLTQISIDGKMGVNKAGNYLDYVLSDILIHKLIEQTTVKDDDVLVNKLTSLLATDSSNNTNWSLRDASNLKNYVKSNLKLQLDSPADQNLQGQLSLFGTEMPLKEIKVSDIVSHPKYKKFLKEVTTDVFTCFVSLFGNGEAGFRSLPVNVVIFSGRTTSLLSLRKAVKESLALFGRQEHDCLFADLSSRTFIDIDSPVKNITFLKTVVVDGALAYSRGRGGFDLVNSNVYATYGVLFIDSENGCQWLPLIDFRTKPLPKKYTLSDDGITIKQYDTTKFRAATDSPIIPEEVDFTNYEKMFVIQTYSLTPDRDWENNKDDMTSIIGEFDISQTTGIHRISLAINEQNELTFNIDNQTQSMLPRDYYGSDSFAKAMWPIIRLNRYSSDNNLQ